LFDKIILEVIYGKIMGSTTAQRLVQTLDPREVFSRQVEDVNLLPNA
tara:strand:+ start:699 stop:839 length:141 start_codon:yes stop_codon:yes gene_type:complete